MTPRFGDALTYLAGIGLAALFLTPLSWLVSLSLRTQAEVYLGAARFIPEAPTPENFGLILTDGAFGTYLLNAVKLCALGAFGAVMVATPAAYAAARLRFRGKGLVMVGILTVQMISPLVVIIPLYRHLDRLGWLESHAAVIGVYMAIGLPLAVWLIKTGFEAIPLSLEEAAAVDGCSRATILWRITLPLAAPSLASAFILNMILGWSQFLIPFILLTKDGKLPISVAIYNFAGSSNASTTQVLAAACLVAVVPALLAFLALQRLIVRAIMAGAVKG